MNKMIQYYIYRRNLKSHQRLDEIISHHIICWVPDVIDIYSFQSKYIIASALKFKLALYAKELKIQNKYSSWCYAVKYKKFPNIGNWFDLWIPPITTIRILILHIQCDFIYNKEV